MVYVYVVWKNHLGAVLEARKTAADPRLISEALIDMIEANLTIVDPGDSFEIVEA